MIQDTFLEYWKECVSQALDEICPEHNLTQTQLNDLAEAAMDISNGVLTGAGSVTHR